MAVGVGMHLTSRCTNCRRARSRIDIGDVHLPAKLFPKRCGPGAHGTLHLQNVLHVPTSVYNIVGNPGTGEYSDIVLRGLTPSDN